MSNKVRKVKRKAQPKPAYLKNKEYVTLENMLRDVKGTLQDVAGYLRMFDNIETERMTINEIKDIEKTSAAIRLKVPEIIKIWDTINTGLCKIRTEKKIDEADTSELMLTAMDLINRLCTDITEPMSRINDIINRVIGKKEEVINE